MNHLNDSDDFAQIPCSNSSQNEGTHLQRETLSEYENSPQQTYNDNILDQHSRQETGLSDLREMHSWLYDTNSDSDLLTLVYSYDWPAALTRLTFHQNEAMSIGMQRRTPLHIACDLDAPTPMIQALIRAYPNAATMIGTSSMNPMHITVSSQHASVEIVRVLLDGCLDPKLMTSMKDLDGDTPLHTACRCGAPIDVLETLLRANPGVVHERDFEGLTPLLRLWVRYFVILGERVINNVSDLTDIRGDLAEAWYKTELLLRASYCGCVDEVCFMDVVHDTKKIGSSQVKACTSEECGKSSSIEETNGKSKCLTDNFPYPQAREGSDHAYETSVTSLPYSLNIHEEDCKLPLMSDSIAATTTMTGVSDILRKTEISGIEQMDILERRGSDASHVSSDLGTLMDYWRMPFLVHAAAATDCPRAVLKIATILYPEQLENYDDSGRTPLMIAATAPVYKEHDLSDEGYCLDDFIHNEEENEKGNVAGDVYVDLDDIDDGFEPNQPSVIQVLLDAGADATRGNPHIADGRIPINLAILSGKRWREGIQKLKRGYPDSLVRVDKATGLYPFMLAAAVGVGSFQKDVVKGRKADLFTIFSLLRSRPEAIRVAAEEKK